MLYHHVLLVILAASVHVKAFSSASLFAEDFSMSGCSEMTQPHVIRMEEAGVGLYGAQNDYLESLDNESTNVMKVRQRGRSNKGGG